MIILKGSQYLGFIYDESIGIELKHMATLLLKSYSSQSPFVATFRLFNEFELVFVNIHITRKELDKGHSRNKHGAKLLTDLVENLKNTIGKTMEYNSTFDFVYENFQSKNMLLYWEILIVLRQILYSNHW